MFFIFALIIYNTTKLLKQKEEVGSAFVGGLAGIVIYFMVYLIFGNRLMALVVGARIWMITLRVYILYAIGWLKVIVITVITAIM
jgi:hypothetical protein